MPPNSAPMGRPHVIGSCPERFRAGGTAWRSARPVATDPHRTLRGRALIKEELLLALLPGTLGTWHPRDEFATSLIPISPQPPSRVHLHHEGMRRVLAMAVSQFVKAAPSSAVMSCWNTTGSGSAPSSSSKQRALGKGAVPPIPKLATEALMPATASGPTTRCGPGRRPPDSPKCRAPR